jgi:pyrrolidone-carboxylate peptidase
VGPPGWVAEPLSWIGMRWPDADPARLAVMSDSWLEFARGVEAKLWNLERATEDLQAHNDGAAVVGLQLWFNQAEGPRDKLQNTALSSQEIAAALRALAAQAVVMQAAFVAELALLCTGVAAIARAVAAGAVLAAAGQAARTEVVQRVRGALAGTVLRAAGMVMIGGSVFTLLSCAKSRLDGPRLTGASREELGLLVSQRAAVNGILASTGMTDRIARFRAALNGATSIEDAQRLVREHGEGLWQAAVGRVRSGVGGGGPAMIDDRPLYWARLEMAAALRDWRPGYPVEAADRDGLIQELDRTSRGMTTDQFPPGTRRVFVTGFDPFQLDYDPRTSNSSGAVALALDGEEIVVNGQTYRIQTAMLPVRFADFDAGLAKDLFGPKLDGDQRADMILTVSLDANRPVHQLEHYLSDQSGDFNDNAGQHRQIGPIPGLDRSGMLESTLPERKMEAARTSYPVEIDTSRGTGPGARGSGGNYLSNEVPRRVADLREQLNPTLPTGHLHVPEANTPSERLRVINDVKAIIRAGLTR